MPQQESSPQESIPRRQQISGRNLRELRSQILGIRLERQIPFKGVPRYEYDSEANAGYLYLSRSRVVGSSQEVTDSIIIDRGANGEVVGVELLFPIQTTLQVKGQT